jgi:hypothetical protein
MGARAPRRTRLRYAAGYGDAGKSAGLRCRAVALPVVVTCAGAGYQARTVRAVAGAASIRHMIRRNAAQDEARARTLAVTLPQAPKELGAKDT